MDFDSHTSDVLAAAVAVVNLLTPGEARGRPHPGDDGPGVEAALVPREDHWFDDRPPAAEMALLRGWAGRMYTVFADVERGDLDSAAATVNALLTETGAVPVLARHGDRPWHLHFHAVDAGWARSWAASMATALAVVLGNPAHDRLGVCSAPACDRVFIDVSRNGTRRFCSTACQNRVKAAAFRARRRED
ncbi:hypothetical protein GCM10009613_38270 [Pseudonocardia kongjuensis]|uniref:Zinc finger CGNR domain-containing protein n=1 Tax=Pseudonocardia kongjuensis TaxID=102227 RepID=A0ABN1Y2X6_9PSEU